MTIGCLVCFRDRYIVAEIQLPIKLNNYINIFNKKSNNKLLFNHPKDHAIKINNKDLLYRS